MIFLKIKIELSFLYFIYKQGNFTHNLFRKFAVNWNPSLAFMKAGVAKIKLKWFAEEVSVKWTLSSVKRPLFPSKLVQCSMSAMGKNVQGFGYDWHLQNAAMYALAEAWERLLFQIYREQADSFLQTRFSSCGYAAGRNVEESELLAEAEYKERYLVFRASLYPEKMHKFEFKDLVGKTLYRMLERRFQSSLKSYLYKEEEWGSVLLLWMYTENGIIFDSQFVCKDEVSSSHRILMSLFASLSIPNEELLKSKPFNFPVLCLERTLRTYVLHEGAVLPAVAVAYHATMHKPYLNEISQKELFGALFRAL